MRIVDDYNNPSIEENNRYPALVVTKGIDIGPLPEDNPNEENSRLAKEIHQYKEAVVKQSLNNILTYGSNTHEILALTHILLLKQTHVTIQSETMSEGVLNKTYNDFKDKLELKNTVNPRLLHI
ncbi:hypothetical protein BDC45DRAFT_568563 [Circinella umbellata]|nr:hypothetical protein BDC45DRAFT_568563 [Circinella umbellata]